ncbi:MAG: diguanylate cyclase [Acidobacteria bacterium]|nr:diguanylate cyclase [Acidobacteriota bacterium]
MAETKFISLKGSLDRMDRLEQSCQAALEAYLALIDSVDRHTLSIQPELEREFRGRLAAIRRRARENPEPGVLSEARGAADQSLAEHAERALGILRGKTEEIRRILLVLAEAGDTIKENSGVHGAHFRKIAERLETTALLDDLGQIRRSLSAQVTDLNQGVETMRRDGQGMVAKMRSEVDHIRKRLARAERMAETDPLTGLLNRRGMERCLEQAIAQKKQFSILLFDLDRFKTINDRYGHLCGDEVLKGFAQRLEAQFRSSDAVARWGGDEFLALIPGSVRDAVARSRTISQQVCGSLWVQTSERELRIPVSASVGLAEYRPGQPIEDLFASADKLLYQNKQAPDGSGSP